MTDMISVAQSYYGATRPHASFAWTQEAVRDLLHMHEELNFSAARIALELGARYGGHVTRNSVLGKLSRLGKCTPLPEHLRQRREKARTRVRVRRSESKRRDAPKAPTVAPAIRAETIPLAQRRQLLDLKSHHCRFPYGDVGEEGFFFCGGDVAHDGASYCAAHLALVYGRGEERHVGKFGGRFVLQALGARS